jgi:putative transcriptional regulator
MPRNTAQTRPGRLQPKASAARKHSLELCYAAQHPFHIEEALIRCHLSTLITYRGLAAARLARLAGVNRSTVAALASGRATRIDLDAVERICVVLGCTVGDLFEIAQEPGQPPRERMKLNATPPPDIEIQERPEPRRRELE